MRRAVARMLWRPMSGGWRMRAARRMIVAALFCTLVVDAFHLPHPDNGDIARKGSDVRGWLNEVFGARGPTRTVSQVDMYAAWTGGGYEVTRHRADSKGYTFASRFPDDARLICTSLLARSGFWAPVRERRFVQLMADVNRPRELGDDEAKALLRSAVLTYLDELDVEPLAKNGDGSALRYLRRGAAEGGLDTGWRVYWPGVWHTALAASAAGLMVWLAGVESMATVVAVKRGRRRRRGLCVYCAYDLGGAVAGGMCPECGRAVGA